MLFLLRVSYISAIAQFSTFHLDSDGVVVCEAALAAPEVVPVAGVVV